MENTTKVLMRVMSRTTNYSEHRLPSLVDLDLDDHVTREIIRKVIADQSTWSFLYVFGVAFATIMVDTVTVVANGAVLLMFVTTRSLRRCKNVYIASLAMADFLIGLTMPVAIAEAVDPEWTLSGHACKFYLVVRYSLLLVSMLSILMISVDRAWSIHCPFAYRVRQSRRLAGTLVTACWLLAFALNTPPIVVWDAITGDSTNETVVRGCNVPYRGHFTFLLISSLLEYLLPICAIVIINFCLYKKISQRKRIKIRRSLSASDTLCLSNRKSSSDDDNNGGGGDDTSESFSRALLYPKFDSNGFRRNSNCLLYDPRCDQNCSKFDPHTLKLEIGSHCQGTQKMDTLKVPVLARHQQRRHSDANYVSIRSTYPPQRSANGHRRVSIDTFLTHASSFPPQRGGGRKFSLGFTPGALGSSGRPGLCWRKQSDDLVRELLVKQDKKAACSLGVLVTVFTLCWTPSTVASVVESCCGTCLNPVLKTFLAWVLLFNSTINPFLYGFLNIEFRKILVQWLHCRLRPTRRRTFGRRKRTPFVPLPIVHDAEVKDNGVYSLVKTHE